MKISRKKKHLYTAIELGGMILCFGCIVVMFFCRMIEADTGALIGAVLTVAGAVIWILGSKLRASLYVCPVCGWVYEEALGFPYEGIAPGTPWEAVPEGFICPMENCEVPKSFFAEYNA